MGTGAALLEVLKGGETDAEELARLRVENRQLRADKNRLTQELARRDSFIDGAGALFNNLPWRA